MIKIYFYLIFFAMSLFAIEIEGIIKSIDKINSSVKIPKKVQYDLYDPFSSAKPILNTKNDLNNNIVSVKKPLILQTILNNRAFIDGKWYNEGDKVRHYYIKSINSDSLVLSQGKKIKTIRLTKIKNILNMKEQER